MDVTFTNILEGARQYFQGLPAGTGSTASPAYSTEGHHQNDPEQNQGMPPSSNSYWPPQPTETARPPTREHTPVQRPSSHSSDSSRPSSHSQYIQNVSMDQSRIHYPSSYQEQYLTSQQHQQSFQFPRPQSREAPSNHQYQSHIPTNSPYHQTASPYQIPSPQLPRTPSREQMVPRVPSREQNIPQTPSREQSLPRVPSQEQLVPRVPSREQLVSQYASSSENYNFPQQRTYFPVQSQPKPVPSNNAYKPQTSNHSYPSTSQQQNAYYKHIYSSQAQTSHQNMYVNTRPSNAQQPEVNPQQNTHPATMSVDNTEHAFKTTHNLPPIAALSNYHSSRTTREPARTVISSSNSRTKLYTSSSYSIPSSHQNSSTTNNAASIIQQNPARSLPSTAPVAASNYHQDYRSYTTQAQQQQQYQYHSTVTTQSYNQVTMTTSNTSNYYPNPNQSQSSSQTYYQMTKSNPQMVSRSQPSVNPPINQSNNSVDQNGRQVMKRESPLDLSVKTVRTPADSTLGDAENEARNKYFQNSRPVHSSISAQNYPQLDVHSLRQTISQRSVQLPTVTAPKVEFHPNFNVPTLNQPIRPPPKRTPEEPRRNVIPEKAHSNNRPMYDNKGTYQSGSTNRYPAVSIPTVAHVNSYIQSQQVTPKTQMNNFPSPSHKTNSIYAIPPQEAQKKRSNETAPQIVPNKIPKVDPWRQSIDLQIEQRLYNYKQQQAAKLAVPTTKQSFVNGTYNNLTQDKTKDIYPSYQKQNYENITPHSSYNTSHYQIQNNHNQTYVPSPATHQYPGYAGFSNQQTQQSNSYLQPSSRSNSNPSLTTLTTVKNNLGGAVDKRVLSLLRNSLEVKGQKKLEQLKTNENLTHHPRSDIQHPSTDVTAPLQPKPGLISRNNVSPFTPTSFPDNSNLASMYKFHIPKAIDSVNFETNKNLNSAAEKQTLDTVITNHASSNADYDGLAAFLAARIRTKGELKQGGSVTQNSSNNNTSINDVRLQGIIENQLKSPVRQDTSQSSTYYTSSSTTSSTSPIKACKERQTAFAPRKRLFSRNEEDPSNNNVPPRDKSGLRSSSETSVFDFPDSDSETDMNGRESLEAMRKGRKSSLKQSTPINLDLKIESPRPASPSDDIFAQLCDNFVEQLKSGSVKRKARRKKPMEPEVLAKLETVTKENPLENEIVVKIEAEEIKQSVEIKKACEKDEEVTIEIHVDIKTEKENKPIPMDTNPEKDKLKIESDSKSDTGSGIKTEDPIFAINKENVRRRLMSSSDTSDSETEPSKIKVENKDDVKLTTEPPNSSNSVTTPQEEEKEKDADSDVKKESDGPQKRNEIVIRPAKKPSFGDGSDFYPGWEEGVYKYKKSLRMPPTLIQVSRPPQFHRLSTSLPDLDPCPQSPTTSIIADNEKDTPTKSKLKKIKSEPIDSDNESNSSFNIFNKKTNYDSEGSASVRSLPNTAKEMSILDKLLEKCGGRKKRKYKRKDDHSPKIIPKAENPVELLPTPSLQIQEAADKKEKKLATSVIKSESALLGFRKKTINNFKDAFIKNANNIVGVNEQFATVVLKSRTRKETRVLKQRATIKEVFGEDRPASAPPVTCVNDLQIKQAPEIDGTACLGNLVIKLEKQDGIMEKENDAEKSNIAEIDLDVADPKQMLKNKLLNKGKKKENNSLLKNLVNKKIKTEIQEEIEDDTRSLEEIVIKRDPDDKSETPSIDGDDGSVSGRRRGKFGKMRRKLSSGFDYIRKKKKIKKEAVENEPSEKRKRKIIVSKNLESVDDIQKEIKTWVLNKGIGETHLHRAARLGYTDITAYCLEKMDCNPSPKDNAGYTPLHEACSRGHLDIAKLLLLYGANPSESAQGGIRPLHEAVENGFVEIARLLLSYGADPTLATYSGLTPLALTNDEVTKEFLKNHLNDIEGEPSSPWTSHGPAILFDPVEDIGFNILDNTPNADPELEEDDIEIELSETLLPNLYTLRNEAPSDRWILLQDLSNLLKIKSRDALLRQICPPSTSSASVNYKTVLRELKMSDFLEQAHCCQFLNAGEKINTRASKIALVKYTEKVRELLNVEMVTINVR